MKRAFQGFSLATLLVVAACYDWTVRASADADVDATTGNEAGADAGDASEGDGASDATGLDASSCAVLTQELDEAYAEATSCTLGNVNHCRTTIQDECDCNRFVAQPDAGKTSAYVQAVARFKAAGCKRKPCPPCVLTGSNCIQNEAGATLCANF